MINRCVLSVALLIAFASQAQGSNLTVGREFVCKPMGEVSTCMQGTLLADEITMALLAGATPAKAAQVADWAIYGRRADDLGFSKHAVRMASLAFKSLKGITAQMTLQARRAEVDGATKFLVPFARIETLTRAKGMGNVGEMFKFSAIEDASRVRYSAQGIDICTTAPVGRYCVRLPLLKTGKTLAQAWDAVQLLPASAFDKMVPTFQSASWRDHTFVGVEVEVEDKTVHLVDGERIVRAKPIQMVMFNVGYLIGSENVLTR